MQNYVIYVIADIPRLKGFLKELDKTAEYLKLYGVEVGFVSILLLNIVNKVLECNWFIKCVIHFENKVFIAQSCWLRLI